MKTTILPLSKKEKDRLIMQKIQDKAIQVGELTLARFFTLLGQTGKFLGFATIAIGMALIGFAIGSFGLRRKTV
jgi:hypothetical protein